MLLTHRARLSSWNLPYAAFISSIPKNPDQPSPFGPLNTTPEYLNIHSPDALTPGREAAGPSPNMQLVYQKVKEDRASLFLQGRLKELVVSMCREDRRYVLMNLFPRFNIPLHLGCGILTDQSKDHGRLLSRFLHAWLQNGEELGGRAVACEHRSNSHLHTPGIYCNKSLDVIGFSRLSFKPLTISIAI